MARTWFEVCNEAGNAHSGELNRIGNEQDVPHLSTALANSSKNALSLFTSTFREITDLFSAAVQLPLFLARTISGLTPASKLTRKYILNAFALGGDMVERFLQTTRSIQAAMLLHLPLTLLIPYAISVHADTSRPVTGVSYCKGKKLKGECNYIQLGSLNYVGCYSIPENAGSLNVFQGAAVWLYTDN